MAKILKKLDNWDRLLNFYSLSNCLLACRINQSSCGRVCWVLWGWWVQIRWGPWSVIMVFSVPCRENLTLQLQNHLYWQRTIFQKFKEIPTTTTCSVSQIYVVIVELYYFTDHIKNICKKPFAAPNRFYLCHKIQKLCYMFVSTSYQHLLNQ